jgi:apolipoprotein N-acyltransferase
VKDWFQRRSPPTRFLIAVALGAGIGLGHAPWSIVYASLIALFLTVFAFRAIQTWKPAAWFGWAIGIGYFGATMFWIVEPFLVEPERHAWMAPFALVLFVGGLALFWSLGFGLAGLGRTRAQRLCGLVVALGLAELLRSYALTGFPWGLLGYIWLDTPFDQLAAFIGPHGLGAFALMIVALPLMFRRRRTGIALVVALLAAGFGLSLNNTNTPQRPATDPAIIRLIQPNAPQHQKWNPRFANGFFRRQLELTAAPSERLPDLIIWPEASVTFWLEDEPDLQRDIIAASRGVPVVIGARRIDGRRFYNSMAVLGEHGQVIAIYDKTHLVPFGEYIPFGELLSRFGVNGLAAKDGGGFSSGNTNALIDLGTLGKVLPLICYEAIFPHLSRSEIRPDWILQITNDAWFGQLAGPQQHLVQARMRAIETGLPLVRVANTGISAVIDPKGRITDQLAMGMAGHLDARLPTAQSATPYYKTGDWPLAIVLLLGLGSLLIIRRRN